MPASNLSMIHKLQKGINFKGGHLLVDRVQFFSKEQNRPITVYKICNTIPVAGTDKAHRKKDVLFEATSQIQVVLFLRDYWFVMNGKELPVAVNNKKWDEIREKHLEAFDTAHEIWERRLLEEEGKDDE